MIRRKFISVLILFLFIGSVYAQNNIRMDSVAIRFLPLMKEADSADLVMKVIYENLTNRPIEIYRLLSEGNTGDNFHNIFIEMQRKDSNGKYKNLILRFYQSDYKTYYAPANRHFDIERVALPALTTDTLLLELLSVAKGFNKGEYRFKAHLRVSTIWNDTPYDIEKDSAKSPPDNDIKYVVSDWIYFKVSKNVFRMPINADGTPRKIAN